MERSAWDVGFVPIADMNEGHPRNAWGHLRDYPRSGHSAWGVGGDLASPLGRDLHNEIHHCAHPRGANEIAMRDQPEIDRANTLRLGKLNQFFIRVRSD